MSNCGKLVSLPMPVDDDAPDQSLVARAQRGDRGALGVLVRRHQRAVFALCLRYVGDADEAADLVQRAFVRVMTKLPDLREAGLFRAWLLRIGAHLALNHIRDHARFVSDQAIDTDSGVQAGAEERASSPVAMLERLEAAESAEALREAVRGLPTKQRMTLELRIHEDLPFRDIGAALGISEGAAKVNFHYAVRNLRGKLAPTADAAGRRGKKP
jgi:RNA polymerase sigma-70 factor (ECF subfamily)